MTKLPPASFFLQMNVSSFPVDTVLQGPEQGGSIQPIEVSALYSSFWRLVVVISSSELETPHFEQFESAAPHIQTPKMGATVSEERAVLMAACRNKAPRACAAPRPSASAWAVPQGLSSLEPGSPLREHTAGRKPRDTALGSRTEERGKAVGDVEEGAKGGRGKREKRDWRFITGAVWGEEHVPGRQPWLLEGTLTGHSSFGMG